jgi:hypothetical protein
LRAAAVLQHTVAAPAEPALAMLALRAGATSQEEGGSNYPLICRRNDPSYRRNARWQEVQPASNSTMVNRQAV